MLDTHGAFDGSIGLVDGRPASRKMKHLIDGHISLGSDSVVDIALETRHSEVGTCRRGDVVCIKEKGMFRAGHVHLHCCVDGVAMTRVAIWKLHRHAVEAGPSVWEKHVDSEFVKPACIFEVAVYQNISDGKAGTFLQPLCR